MIYAVKHNKVNRGLYKANEDSLTASVFERLMYLPKELFQHILEKALYDAIPGLNLQTLESIDYWPNWNAENTTNSHSVLPDIFIRTGTADIIIEAKRYDKGQQTQSQWRNEIQAYYNEFREDQKNLIFIALGGLHSESLEILDVNGNRCTIYKCTWERILEAIKEVKFRLEHSTNFLNHNLNISNILNDIILCFGLYGFSTADNFEKFLPSQNIKISSINTLSLPWKN